MIRTVILNASPLILLGRTGYLRLIFQLFPESIIPSAVVDEIMAQNTPDALAIKQEVDAGNIQVETPTPEKVQTITRICRKDLALGEIQTLALALDLQDQKKRLLVILDDLPARRTAEALGLSLIGTLGIIIRALRKQLINKSEAKHIVYRLTQVGAYFDIELIQEVLRTIKLNKDNSLS